MKYVIYFLYVFSIKLLLADLEIAIVHLHDVHDNLTFDDNFTDNQGLENETDYFIDHLPKLVRFINWIRNENKQRRVHTIVLNTASFTGTKWSSKARKESIKLMNQLDIDCSSIGTHGFNFDNLYDSEAFISELDFPVVCSTFGGDTRLRGVENSYVLNINNIYKIGIIGYYTPHTSSTGKIGFIKESVALKHEAKKLRKDGIKTIIALGHSGRDHETVFAKTTKDVDLYVGSHLKKYYKSGQTSQVYPLWIWEDDHRIFKYFEIYRFSKDMHITKFNIKVDEYTGVIYDSKLSSILDNPDKLAQKLIVMERSGFNNIQSNDNFDDGYPPYINFNQTNVRSKGCVHIRSGIRSCLYFLLIILIK